MGTAVPIIQVMVMQNGSCQRRGGSNACGSPGMHRVLCRDSLLRTQGGQEAV